MSVTQYRFVSYRHLPNRIHLRTTIADSASVRFRAKFSTGSKQMKRLAWVLVLGCMSTFCGAQTTKPTTITGYISDSKCGAMHMDNGMGCVRQCIESGRLPVFVDGQKKVWSIDNPTSVKGYYGDNVKIVATVDASSKSIRVEKITKTSGVMGGMKDGMHM